MARTRSEHLKILLSDIKNKAQQASANSINFDYATQELDTNIDTFQLQSNSAVGNAKQMLAKSGQTDPDRNWYQKLNDLSNSLIWDFTYGMFSAVDDVFDLLVNVGGEVGSWFGGSKDWAKNVTSFDWQAYASHASNISGHLFTGDVFSEDYWNAFGSAEDIHRFTDARSGVVNEFLGDTVGNFTSGLVSNLGYMIPSLAMGAGIGSTASLITTGVTSFAGQTNDAYEETGDFGKSASSGLASAIVEVASELVVGKALEGLNLGTGKIAGMFKSGKTPPKTTSFIKDLSKTMFEEGVEEAFSAVMQPVVDSLYKGKEAFKNAEGEALYFDKDFWFGGNESVASQAISGAVLGGVLGGVSLNQQYKALSPDGVNANNLLEKNQELYEKLSKYEKTDPKYQEITDEISANAVEIAKLVENVKNNGTQEQKENVAMLLGAPTQLIAKFNKDAEAKEKALNKSIDRKLKQLNDVEKFGTTNLFNEMKNNYGEDYKLKFTELKDDTNARVDSKRKEILINSKLEGNFAPALAHEYIGHVIGDNMDAGSRQKIFDSVVKTEWFKKYAKALRKAYSTTDKTLWQTEVINNYIEDVLTKSTNAKSVKMINDVFLRNTLLNRFTSAFKKDSNFKLLKNNSILNEFAKGIKRVLELTNKNIARALEHHVVGQDLSDEEKKYYEKYKELFDFVKENYKPQMAYSKKIRNYTVQISHEERMQINKQLEQYFSNSEHTTITDFVAIVDKTLYIVDGSIENNDEIRSAIFDKIKFNDYYTKSAMLKAKELLEDEIRRYDGFSSRISKEFKSGTSNNSLRSSGSKDGTQDSSRKSEDNIRKIRKNDEHRIIKKSKNLKYSEFEDSEGESLTEQQYEYFKDSKFVDDNGNLLRLYHGSNSAGFMEFKSNTGVFFLTPEIEVARSYTNTSNLVVTRKFNNADELIDWFYNESIDYLPNVENYDLMESDDEILENFKDYFETLESVDNSGKFVEMRKKQLQECKYVLIDNQTNSPASFYDSEKELLDNFLIDIQTFDQMTEDEIEQMKDWDEDYQPKTTNIYSTYVNVTNPLVIKCGGRNFLEIPYKGKYMSTDDIAMAVKAEGKYDGIIFKNIVDNGDADFFNELGASDVYVAFEANQIKAVDNYKPTKKKDIRYSKSLKTTNDLVDNNTVETVEGQSKSSTEVKDNLEPYETNKAKEIKEGMQEKEGKVISVVAVERIYDDIEKAIQTAFGDTFKIKNKTGKARRLFEEYNISKNSAKKDNCKKFMKDLLQQELPSEEGIVIKGTNDSNATYEDYLKSIGIDPNKFVDEGATALYEALNAKAKDSETTKKINRLNKAIDTLTTAVKEHKATIKFIQSLNAIKNDIKKKNPKIGNTGQLDLKSGVMSAYASFFNQFRYTKNGFVSMSNLQRLSDMVADGTFDKFIDAILHQSEDVNNLDSLVNYAEIIKSMADELVASKVDGQTHMSYEQTMMFVDMNKVIYKLYKEQIEGVKENARDQAKPMIKAVKKIADRFKKRKIKFNSILRRILDYISPKEFFATIFGGTHTKEFNQVYNELFVKPYTRQIEKYTSFLMLRDKCISTISKLFNNKITIDGVKMPKYVLYEFYLNTLSPDNDIRMRKGGITYTDKATVKLDYDKMREAIIDKLSDAEKADLDALFELYNNELREYVENGSLDLVGVKTSRPNYYPIHGNEANKVQDLGAGNSQLFSISAMNNGRLKNLSNTKTVIELNHNPMDKYREYVNSMTITFEIGKASQKLNRLFQLKNEDGESVLSVSSQIDKDMPKYLKSAYQKLIGNLQGVERKGFLDKIVGNFATSRLGLNVRSMLKQIGSYFTAWAQVGMKVSIKSLSPRYWNYMRKNLTAIKNNPVFKHRIYNNDYIKAVTLSAGAKEFASSFTRKVIEYSMKGIELMDRMTCYSTYTLALAYVESTSTYKMGSPEFQHEVDDMFNHMILETQSNADRISISRIRSGEKGVIAKNLFGLFGSDSQNKASLLYNVMNDTVNIKAEIKELEARLESAQDSEKAEIQKQLDTANENLKHVGVQARAYVAGLVASATVVLLVDMLCDWLLKNEEPEDEEFSTYVIELFCNTTLDWLPYVNTIINWFTYDGASLSILDPVNELIDALKKLGDGEVTQQDVVNALMKVMEAFGVPVGNATKLVEGIIYKFDPSLALKHKSVYYAMSQSYLNTQANAQIEKGNKKDAVAYTAMNFEYYKFTASDEVIEEIVDLKIGGEDISIRNVPTSISDEAGNEIPMTQTQIAKFKQYYSLANAELEKVIKDSNYQSLSMNEKAKVIKKISDAYFEYAKAMSLGLTPTSKIAKLLVYSNGKMNITTYALMAVKLSSIEGKNRKQLILKELNKVRSLSRNEKMLIMNLLGFGIAEENKSSMSSFLKKSGLSDEAINSFI